MSMNNQLKTLSPGKRRILNRHQLSNSVIKTKTNKRLDKKLSLSGSHQL